MLLKKNQEIEECSLKCSVLHTTTQPAMINEEGSKEPGHNVLMFNQLFINGKNENNNMPTFS